ncbi:MAG: glycosyltransferase family 4 protein, partial [Bryobacteraceae bacterium]
MKILLLNQFFWPELAATSQLLTDLARHLAAEGHDVQIICASSSYAGADSTGAPPVTITRVPDLPFRRGLTARALSYASFLLGAFWYGLRSGRPDLVITLTTPPMLSAVGVLIQKLRGARFYIWEMDMYPDVAVDLKMLDANSLIARVCGAIVDYTRRQADGIIALGECMRQRLLARGVPSGKIFIAENWADGERIYPLGGAKHGGLAVLYPGNLGLAHDVDTIAAAMRSLKDDGRLRFTFVGGGGRIKPLAQVCEANGVRHATFLAYCNPDELSQLMGRADIGLVTQNPACVGSVVPSKVYAIMAAGLPLLFIGPASAQPARVLSRYQCGWQLECGDSAGLV